jgi:hypothetical protein
MFQLLITTCSNRNENVKSKIVPVNTVIASFMSEDERDGAVAALKAHNEARYEKELVNVVGHINYLWVKL